MPRDWLSPVLFEAFLYKQLERAVSEVLLEQLLSLVRPLLLPDELRDMSRLGSQKKTGVLLIGTCGLFKSLARTYRDCYRDCCSRLSNGLSCLPRLSDFAVTFSTDEMLY